MVFIGLLKHIFVASICMPQVKDMESKICGANYKGSEVSCIAKALDLDMLWGNFDLDSLQRLKLGDVTELARSGSFTIAV